MNLGDTFKAVDHLWVVVADGATDGALVTVNFTTWRPKCDDENCIVEVGEHPFVKHKSVVAYEKARLLKPAEQAQVACLCPSGPRVSAALLEKIQLGGLKSDLLVQKYQARIKQSRLHHGLLIP